MVTTEEKINDLFVKYTDIDFIANAELQDKKLMGIELGIPPRAMAFLYCKLEEELNLVISQDSVIKGKFDTFRNICHSVITKANDTIV